MWKETYYQIVKRGTTDVITVCDTLEEAKYEIDKLEIVDEKSGCYEKNNYCVKEKNTYYDPEILGYILINITPETLRIVDKDTTKYVLDNEAFLERFDPMVYLYSKETAYKECREFIESELNFTFELTNEQTEYILDFLEDFYNDWIDDLWYDYEYNYDEYDEYDDDEEYDDDCE